MIIGCLDPLGNPMGRHHLGAEVKNWKVQSSGSGSFRALGLGLGFRVATSKFQPEAWGVKSINRTYIGYLEP